MNRTWHLTTYDLRRHIWVAVFVSLAIVLMLPARLLMLDANDDPSSFMARSIVVSTISLCLVVTWLSLLARVMQGDAAHGTAGQWMTRPISGPRMLASKLLACALLGFGLPWITQAAMMVVRGCPVFIALDSSLALAAMLALFGTPLLLVAALARKFFVFWGILIVAFLALAMVLAARPLFGASEPASVQGVKFGAMLVTADLGALALLWWLYARRRVAPVVFAGLGWLGLAVLIGVFWPWYAETSPERIARIDVPAGASVVVKAGTVGPTSVVSSRSAKRRDLRIEAGLENWPAGAWRLNRINGGLLKAGGGSVDVSMQPAIPHGARFGIGDELANALGEGITWDRHRIAAAAVMPFAAMIDATAAAEATQFSGQARVEKIELRKLGRLELDGSNRIQIGAQRLWVRKMTPQEGRIELQLAFDRFTRGFTENTLEEQALRWPIVVVVDRTNRVRQVSWRGGPTSNMATPGFALELQPLVIPLPEVSVAGGANPGDFSLVVVGEFPVGQCSLPVAQTIVERKSAR